MSVSEFMPHGHCYLWRPEIVWLHVLSDTMIVVAYYTIPFLMAYVIYKAKVKIRYNWLVCLFGIFIVACGTTHLMEIVNVWKSEYVLSGVVKAFTGLVSLLTGVSMLKALPQIIEFLKAADEKSG